PTQVPSDCGKCGQTTTITTCIPTTEVCAPQTTTLCVIQTFGPTFTQAINCLTDTTTSVTCPAPTHFPSDCSNYDTTTITTCTPTTLVCSPTPE
ncbi:25814_t:CDS:1, partial [Racocetra persica]